MLRMHAISSAAAAISYFGRSDGGLAAEELRREWGGKGAERLGLSGEPDFEHFKNLIQGLSPTGEQLTANLIDDRVPGWDVTASIPKGVTTVIERGDSRVHDLLWASVRNAMADMEAMATTRVRRGGEYDDRLTGNLTWFGIEHSESRPTREDNMPDWDRHIHVVVMNLTNDGVEDQWKALKFRKIMELRKYFDRRFDSYMAKGLTDLGYEIETKLKPDGKYHTWDVKGIPSTVISNFSRRTREVEEAEHRTIEAIKARDPDAPDTLSAAAKDKLGATSRQFKRKDLTLDDFRKYWDSRITEAEGRQIAETITRAIRGENPKPVNRAEAAMAWAISHEFERRSVLPWSELATTAMERAMGAAMPGDIDREAVRQGVLIKGGQATTKEVLAQEGRVIGFARSGRGTCGGLGDRPGRQVKEAGQPAAGQNSNRQRSYAEPSSDPATASPIAQPKADLSPEQLAVARHVWTSPDRVIMIRGGAGTGKTHAMKATIAGISKPVVVLAPSAEASRGVLRREGFSEADTVARFLSDERFRDTAKDGVIWVDEAGLLSMRQTDQLFDAAKALNARIVLQGDKKQHGSVERGATLRVLEEFAGLPVAELSEVRRQKRTDYKQAVAAIAKGSVVEGFDRLNSLGWIEQTDQNAPLVAEYMNAIADKKDVLVVAPTHKLGDAITEDIRDELKQRGIVSRDETMVPILKPTHWMEAERGDADRYSGDEVVHIVRNSGAFKAGQRIGASQFLAAERRPKAGHFAVYTPARLGIAAGDRIKITANGFTQDKRHKLNNGSVYQVKCVSKEGDVTLTNDWVVGGDFQHLDHGYVSTSHASQGRTVDRVLIAMNEESRPAINAEQFYVSISRARESARIFSDMAPAELREAIQKSDPRTSATELIGERPDKETRKRFIDRIRRTYRHLRERAAAAIRVPEKRKERDAYAR